MSYFNTAKDFFKTWFLPLPCHDDEDGTATPLHRPQTQPDRDNKADTTSQEPALDTDENPATDAAEIAPSQQADPQQQQADPGQVEETPSPHASYAIPPVPAAMQPAPESHATSPRASVEPPQGEVEAPGPEKAERATPATAPDFSHLVKAPIGAEQRHSRRRTEASDPHAE